MKEQETSPEAKLKEARETLHQEWVHLQVVGYELSAEEQARSLVLSRAVDLIDQALDLLSQ